MLRQQQKLMIKRSFGICQFFLPCVVLFGLHWNAGLDVIFTALLNSHCLLVEGMRAFEVLVLDKCLCLLPTHYLFIMIQETDFGYPAAFYSGNHQLSHRDGLSMSHTQDLPPWMILQSELRGGCPYSLFKCSAYRL